MEQRPHFLLQVLLFIFLVTNGAKNHRAAAQVFCRSQFNLANEACSLKMYAGATPVPLELNETAAAASYGVQEHEHGRDGRGHHHHHHADGDPYDTACCRRLMGIDNACICQVMARLPVFMAKVKHVITLTPVPGCDVSFECSGY